MCDIFEAILSMWLLQLRRMFIVNSRKLKLPMHSIDVLSIFKYILGIFCVENDITCTSSLMAVCELLPLYLFHLIQH